VRARAVAATSIAAMTAVAAAPAMASTGRAGVPGEPAGSGHGAALARTAPPARVSVSITSVSPQIARPGRPVTVSGIVSNPTAGPAAGLWVQLWSSGTFLQNRASMALYLSDTVSTGFDQPVSGAERVFASPLPPHSTRPWSLTFRPSQVGMRSFGVYPLAAELNGPLAGMDAARTFLPFWPGKPASQAVKPLRAAWVWPLIDSPQQAACTALRTDELATSVTANGRLGALLAAGRTQAARQARLTWAIDPALINDASLMTHPYRVGVSDTTCTGGKARPASGAARAWLAGVRAVASQQDFFITPYADVDVAALVHRGLNGELHAAFGVGRKVALGLLRLTQRPPPSTQGAIAWPPDGVADYSVIEGLAAKNNVRTLILDDSVMPPVVPVNFTPGAVTSTTDGLGNRLHVLLADHTLTHILGTARTQIPGAVPAPSPGTGSTGLAEAATFANEQWFLAETAMIAAEDPSLARSVVIAPPRRWNPPPGMAEKLLTETAHAPWLRPTSLASLAAARPTAGDVKRQQPPQRKMSDGELRAPLLRQVHRLTGQVRLLGSVLSTGWPGSAAALAAIESSAWRGGRAGQRHAQQMLHQVSSYVLAQWSQIQIIGSVHITLGGKSGAVPVSVSNGLNVAVNVGLKVTAPENGQVQVGKPPRVITVDAHTQRTIKLSVRTAAAGSTTLTLQLTTRAGRPLPGQSATLTVEATHFGTLALVIIVVALVVFVLTAAGRAFRRGGPAPGDAGEGEDGSETHQTRPHTAPDGAEEDSVVGQGADARAAEEADDHASTPGQAQRR